MIRMISHGEEEAGTKNPDGTYTYTYRVNRVNMEMQMESTTHIYMHMIKTED